jgi:uncharacterized membrane-anchored protein
MTDNRCASLLSEASKVPAATFGFWVNKIFATILGDTGGDWVTMSLKLGYLVGTAIFVAIFMLVWLQVKASKFRPAFFGSTIVATTTLGTTMADFADCSLGIGYPGGVAIVGALLAVSLLVWRWSEGTVSVKSMNAPKAEWFYWVTILFSQTFEAALGDWLAGSDRGGFGFGYEYGALVFSAGLAVVAALYLWTKLSHTIPFWAAFVLTRPLGATLGGFPRQARWGAGAALQSFGGLDCLTRLHGCLRRAFLKRTATKGEAA